MKDIIINEWKGLLRNRLFLYLILFFIVSLALITAMGIKQNQVQIEAQHRAHAHIRGQWDDMKPSNPHGAAHFGSYIFKQNTVLNSMDEGINAVTGNVLRLEGHTQNDLVYSEASQSLLISKFGKLKPSLLLQFIIPLFIIFLAFNTYIQERDSGRLKLILIQGKNLNKLLFAKIAGIWLIGVILLFLAIGIQLLMNTKSMNTETCLRLILLGSGYALYYLIVTTLTVVLSVMFKSNTASLAFMIGIWVMWTVFLPKIAGNAVANLSPLPTRVEFRKAMDEDRSKGIDGHNPSGDREKELEKATLAQYKVDSLNQLPINFDGLVMQADEDYGNKVWDKHFGKIYEQLKSQKKYYQWSGVLNPFASLQNLSMGTAGTDMLHHLDFLKEAESYRRVFIKTLNEKHAYGGSKTGDWDWKADNAFFRSVEDFDYNIPSINSLWTKYFTDMIILVIWATMMMVMVYFLSKRISIL